MPVHGLLQSVLYLAGFVRALQQLAPATSAALAAALFCTAQRLAVRKWWRQVLVPPEYAQAPRVLARRGTTFWVDRRLQRSRWTPPPLSDPVEMARSLGVGAQLEIVPDDAGGAIGQGGQGVASAAGAVGSNQPAATARAVDAADTADAAAVATAATAAAAADDAKANAAEADRLAAQRLAGMPAAAPVRRRSSGGWTDEEEGAGAGGESGAPSPARTLESGSDGDGGGSESGSGSEDGSGSGSDTGTRTARGTQRSRTPPVAGRRTRRGSGDEAASPEHTSSAPVRRRGRGRGRGRLAEEAQLMAALEQEEALAGRHMVGVDWESFVEFAQTHHIGQAAQQAGGTKRGRAFALDRFMPGAGAVLREEVQQQALLLRPASVGTRASTPVTGRRSAKGRRSRVGSAKG